MGESARSVLVTIKYMLNNAAAAFVKTTINNIEKDKRVFKCSALIVFPYLYNNLILISLSKFRE